MKLLIVGAGMYVTGRGGTGMGTVLTAAMQSLSDGNSHRITVTATRRENRAVVTEACARAQAELQIDIEADYESFDGTPSGLANVAKDRSIDAAIVSTPDHLHFEQVKTLLELGIHVLSVKPLVATVDEHRKLIETASASGAYGAIEFHKRWDESNRHVRKAIDEGTLGKLHSITVDYSQRISIPLEVFKVWADKSNIFQYLGIHYVDLVQWLTGSTPKRLMAYGTKGLLAERGLDTWDSVHVWLEWQRSNGDEFLSQYNLSWIDPLTSSAMSDQRFAILGTGGRYVVDQKNRGIEASLHSNQGVQQINPWFSEILPDGKGGTAMQGYGFDSIDTFLSDIRQITAGNLDPTDMQGRRPTFADCLESTAVIETVNRCLAEGIHEPVGIDR